MRCLLLCGLLLSLSRVPLSAADAAAGNSAAPFEFQDGDRVALIGGTFIEREPRYGYWEHALSTVHPERNIIFRNLGWSGDTVWAESRGVFDPPEKGYERLIQLVQELHPNVLVLNYGANEAWAGPAGVERFIVGYGKLIDDLTRACRTEDSAGKPAAVGPRILLLGPLPLETGTGPNPHPESHNQNIALYAGAIERLAAERRLAWLDLGGLYAWAVKQKAAAPPEPLTDNGVHLSEAGYRRTADWIREQFGSTAVPQRLGPRIDSQADVFLHFEDSPPAIKLSEVPPASRKQETVCLEFTGRLNQVLSPPESTRLRCRMPTLGVYRLEADGEVVARGSAQEWEEGLICRGGPDVVQAGELLAAIRRKNELYFHRWRPENVTYLFLFRKHEQGRNAVEIPQFDPLIAAEEARIAELRIPHEHVYRLVREADRN